MATDTKVRPDRTVVRPEPMVAAPSPGSRMRAILMVVALLAVLGVALVTAVLVSGEPTGSDELQPGVSPVQAERWGEAARETASQELQRFDTYRDVSPAAQAERREVQRFRNAVDVDRLTEAERQEVLRFQNAVDVNR